MKTTNENIDTMSASLELFNQSQVKMIEDINQNYVVREDDKYVNIELYYKKEQKNLNKFDKFI